MGFTPPPLNSVNARILNQNEPNLFNPQPNCHARNAIFTKQAAFGYNQKTPAGTGRRSQKNVGRAKCATEKAPRQRAGSRSPRKAFTPATRFPPLVKHFVRQPTAR